MAMAFPPFSRGTPLNLSILSPSQPSHSRPHSPPKDLLHFHALLHCNCSPGLHFQCQSSVSNRSCSIEADIKSSCLDFRSSCFMFLSASLASSSYRSVSLRTNDFKSYCLPVCSCSSAPSSQCISSRTKDSMISCFSFHSCSSAPSFRSISLGTNALKGSCYAFHSDSSPPFSQNVSLGMNDFKISCLPTQSRSSASCVESIPLRTNSFKSSCLSVYSCSSASFCENISSRANDLKRRCFSFHSDSSAPSFKTMSSITNSSIENVPFGVCEARSQFTSGKTRRSVLCCSLHSYDGKLNNNLLEFGYNPNYGWALRSLTTRGTTAVAFGPFPDVSLSSAGKDKRFEIHSSAKSDVNVDDMLDSSHKARHTFDGHSAALGLFQVGWMPLSRKTSRSAFCNSCKTDADFRTINRLLETKRNSSNISSWPSKIMPPCQATKWRDPFNFGEDPDMEYGDLFSEGKQSPEEPLPTRDPKNPEGPLKFPAFHNLEFASLALKVRGDVRRCCCLVAGGVYENLLFFPVIQLLKDRYPGVRIDIMASERGKQTYEINKNVRRAWVYDLDDMFPLPADYVEGYSKLKGQYYDLLISTKVAGWGHAAFLLLTDATKRLGYVYPNVYSAGAAFLLSEAFKAPTVNLAEAGYNMYAALLDELAKPGRKVPRSKIPPLRVSIGKRVKAVVEEKCMEAGVTKGDFIVFHGIESDSGASMQSKGDPDSLLPLTIWAILAKSTSVKAVFVIPHNKERPKVLEAVGQDAATVFITTPGQLAAIVNDSVGVVTTNTAALQLALALDKPSVAMFASAEKARLFVPGDARRCAVVSSRNGNLKDIDVKAASVAVTTIAKEGLVFA